jgi:RHS repeat-associated protein
MPTVDAHQLQRHRLPVHQRPRGVPDRANHRLQHHLVQPQLRPVRCANGQQRSTSTGYNENPYLFQGGIQGRASGLVKFGLRWYNPATGTFTQQDTLDAPLDLANANRYAFAGGDPVNHVDPSGTHASASCWAQAGRVIFATAGAIFSATTIPGITFGVPSSVSTVMAEPTDAEGNFLC